MSLCDNLSEFAQCLAQSLQEGNTVHALDIFNDNKNNEEVINNSWDLIPVISNFLTDRTDLEVFKCAEILINSIAEQSKPEEALLQFIEEIEATTDDTKLITLLKPLRKLLLRVPDKRYTSIAWCFNSIQTYLNKLEAPEDCCLAEEERLLLDSHPNTERVTQLYNDLLEFYTVFVDELVDTKCSPERSKIVAKFLIQLLGHPLVYLDMKLFKETWPKARRIAERIVNMVFVVVPDPFIFLELRYETHNSDLIRPNDLGLSVFYYLMISEGVNLSSVPKVYDNTYLFQNCLHLVCVLLKQNYQFVIEKGLNFADSLLNFVYNSQLSYLLLDSGVHCNFCTLISSIIVHNQSEKVRKEALIIFKTYLWSFEAKGRYLLIFNLMDNLSHSGLKGFIIIQYKEMMIENRNNEFFTGIKLFAILDKFTFLKDKAATDLIDESDQIVSTLNLIRFLYLSDCCCTDICEYPLEDNYFNYLSEGIKLSKAHYKVEMENVKKRQDNISNKTTISVSGKDLPAIPLDKKMEIIQMSLTTLDVIDSLLNRVIECINSKK